MSNHGKGEMRSQPAEAVRRWVLELVGVPVSPDRVKRPLEAWGTVARSLEAVHRFPLDPRAEPAVGLRLDGADG